MQFMKIVEDYLAKLSKLPGFTLLGCYQQGSQVWGFADSYSDHDFICLWDGNYPEKRVRKELLTALAVSEISIKDSTTSNKGIEYFRSNNKKINVGHKDMSEIYNLLSNPLAGRTLSGTLLRLGGIKHGKILLESNSAITNLRNEISLDSKLQATIVRQLKQEVSSNLHELHISAERNGVHHFLRLLHRVVDDLRMLIDAQKGEFPIDEKWYEASKQGQHDELVTLLGELQDRGINKQGIVNRITKIARQNGIST